MGLLSSLKTMKKNAESKSSGKTSGTGNYEERVFENTYGYFTSDGTEYVIHNPNTPKPWVNVICNGRYGLTISQVGGGFSWLDNSTQSRITRWGQDLIREDWGKFIYVRDEDTGEIWSLTLKPIHQDMKNYECRHGLGYTVFRGENSQIFGELTFFVPMDENCEVWLIRLRNKSGKKRKLSLFTYFEWLLGVWPDTNREFHRLFLETEFDKEADLILARKRFWEVRNKDGQIWNNNYPFIGYHWVSKKSEGFDCDKTSFLGRNGLLSKPHAVMSGRLGNYSGKWDDAIASLHARVEIEPKAEEEVVFLLGAETDVETIHKTVQKFTSPDKAKACLKAAKDSWMQILSGLEIDTPDQAMNYMSNYWLKYQAISARMWGRCGYYQSSGAFGYRDQLQDSQLFLPLDPQRTRRQILLHAEHQFSDGTVLHWWQPDSDEGPPSKHSDDLLWLPFVTVNYLKETGDYAILHEKVPFYKAAGEREESDATLYEHCRRAIHRVLLRFSPRGLPLIGEGDWNDGLSACGPNGKGESVWLGHFLYGVMRSFIPIAKQVGDEPFCLIMDRRASELKEIINQVGWDGQWFWRATTDKGRVLGSHQSPEAKIFLNAQAWAIIHHVVEPERAQLIKKMMEQHLFKDYGPLLFYPAFKTPQMDIGYITRYAPGSRENGGSYTHAGVWAILAECALKDAPKAYETFNRICPIRRAEEPERYHSEPYVLPGNVDGPDSPYFGKGGWTWYTGSAAWLFRIVTEHLLGIRPELDGLLIDPCIPSDWDGFQMVRQFRGDRYHITVRNPNHKSHGVTSLSLDGKALEGTIVTPVGDGKEHRIEAVIG